MSTAENLSWDDVLPAAEIAFNIWVEQPELRWAKTAWGYMIEAGLDTYTSQLEYCKVCIRFLALASLYHDWCCMAWYECQEYTKIYDAAREHLGLSPFNLGQLSGADVFFMRRNLILGKFPMKFLHTLYPMLDPKL